MRMGEGEGEGREEDRGTQRDDHSQRKTQRDIYSTEVMEMAMIEPSDIHTHIYTYIHTYIYI